ncbi:hypothetical protein [Rubellimicrobium mesophilum]|uniref:hypothetical protein n=1 Tax=Rubellimicrobium mesophilum TaxID=1123067 RepID=UPI0012E2C080|nr:hypothetical protein [Rubellimicrobium mesophilum]
MTRSDLLMNLLVIALIQKALEVAAKQSPTIDLQAFRDCVANCQQLRTDDLSRLAAEVEKTTGSQLSEEEQEPASSVHVVH